MIDTITHAWGLESYERLKTAKRYQKLFAKISKRYKHRFRDLTPVEIEHQGNGNYEVTIPEYPAGTQITLTNEN